LSFLTVYRKCWPIKLIGGRRGVVVTRLIRSAKLLYVGPG